MALLTAGNKLVGGSPTGHRGKNAPTMATLGVRALREDLLKPGARGDIPRNLRIIEERFDQDAAVLEPVASEERLTVPRYQHLFQGGELMPPEIFIAALQLSAHETLNGQSLPFDAEVLVLRDNLVMTYKPLAAKIRQMHAKEIADVPARLVSNFTRAWKAFESAWLRNREVHAVQALQPLAKAILSLEPLLHSIEKERLLPWPRVQHQKVVTLKCLEGFMHSFAELAANVLPSLSRELDHDPRLLLLMEHVLSLRGEKAVTTCLDGTSATPQVVFPDQQVMSARGGPEAGAGALLRPGAAAPGSGGTRGGLSLDSYAFRLLGASVGDAVATGKLRPEMGNGQAGRAKLVMSGTMPQAAAGSREIAACQQGRESEISRRSATHAAELLTAFEAVKDFLLGLKTSLEHICPELDRDTSFLQLLQRFDRAFRRARRLFLEPDNLA